MANPARQASLFDARRLQMDEALAVAYTELGEAAPDDVDSWVRVDDDLELTVHSDDPGEPPTVTKTAREWAAEGRGPVCSTEW